MTIDKFTYFFPEKPKLIKKTQLLFDIVSNNPSWIAEFKYNGSRLLLHNFDRKFEFWNRHNNQLNFRPTPEVMDVLKNANLPKGYNLFDGELRHNKVIGVKNKIILYDIFIWNGEVLLNKTFKERRQILESYFNVESEPIGITQQFKNDFNSVYIDAMKNNELEGLIMKNLKGKLNISRTTSCPSQWMLKVRKENRSYRF